MKKYLALALALVMVLGLCACGGTPAPADNTPANGAPADNTPADNNQPADNTPADNAPAGGDNPDDIDDSMTSADGKYQVAFITDVGQLKDKSFNQGTYDGVKLYAANNGLSYKYYQPANGDQATDDDRYDAMKAAADSGAEVIVCAGFMQGSALAKAAAEFTDVKFVFIDGWSLGMDNVAGISFMEQQSGYLAGYAVVKEGFTKLGFCGGGGGTNLACCRYGYGYVQGANAAAAEMGVTVDINYSWEYGASFSASPELQTMANGWYQNGTEIIFACGGSMFQSIVAAASANDTYVIGVDVDQSFESDTVLISALKGLSSSVVWALGKAYDGSWSEIGGNAVALGANDDAVGLPTATWQLENYTVAEYEAQLADMLSGALVVDTMESEDDLPKISDTDWTNVNLNII